jgi:hypothetical protein
MKRAVLFVAFVVVTGVVEIALIGLCGSVEDGHRWLARIIYIGAVVGVSRLLLLAMGQFGFR